MKTYQSICLLVPWIRGSYGLSIRKLFVGGAVVVMCLALFAPPVSAGIVYRGNIGYYVPVSDDLKDRDSNPGVYCRIGGGYSLKDFALIGDVGMASTNIRSPIRFGNTYIVTDNDVIIVPMTLSIKIEPVFEEEVSPYAEVGAGKYWIHVSDPTGKDSVSDTPTGTFFGAGINFNILKKWKFGIGAQYMKVEADLFSGHAPLAFDGCIFTINISNRERSDDGTVIHAGGSSSSSNVPFQFKTPEPSMGENAPQISNKPAEKKQPDQVKSSQREIGRDDRFIAYDNGIVYDGYTGLEWYAGPDEDTNWDEANQWAKNLTIAGGGWRLPARKELKSLYIKGAGLRNMTPLLKTTGWYVWSGETKDSSSAWGFRLYENAGEWWDTNESGDVRGFAVRSR